MEKPKPIFDKRIFWDVNFEKIDYDLRANWVIERVFGRGDVEDVRNCIRYYGLDKIREALVNAKWLSKQTVYFAAAILDNDLTDYRCYKLAQLNPEHWIY
jgi:hypothetical protein